MKSNDTAQPRKILVLGAYGLIGRAVSRHLQARGHRVVAAGRNADSAARVLPGLPFRRIDMGEMTAPEDWADVLRDIDTVVNCAGALQDGPKDNLEALHHHALAALAIRAAQSGLRVVQISAAGVSPEASTRFFASKARGDAALLRSGADSVILRPGLVLAQSAYGGTMLLRMLAAIPFVQPLAMAETPIQTVALPELARAVARAVEREVEAGAVLDLVEDTPQSLAQVIAAHRHALGFAPARASLAAPDWMIAPVTKVADALGRLGWRSPLRSTATEVLSDGVTGDPAPWRARLGPLTPLDRTLETFALGPEHRLQARGALLMPLCVALLALFWALSGGIGLWQLDAASAHLTGIGWSDAMARASVAGWALVDLALAGAVLYRPWAAKACLGMLAVSAVYLISATLLTPQLWADPLGPMVKVLPAMGLALVTIPLLETR